MKFILQIFTLVLLVCGNSMAADFGRLFTTPEQRANLDYLRKTSKAPNLKENTGNIDQTFELPTEPLEPPASVSMQGYVKRSDGKKGTVWVNNTPMQESTKNSDIQIGKLKDSNRVDISLPANSKHLRLKAGQVYDSETNSVVEAGVYAKQQAIREAAEPKTEAPPVSDSAPDATE